MNKHKEIELIIALQDRWIEIAGDVAIAAGCKHPEDVSTRERRDWVMETLDARVLGLVQGLDDRQLQRIADKAFPMVRFEDLVGMPEWDGANDFVDGHPPLIAELQIGNYIATAILDQQSPGTIDLTIHCSADSLTEPELMYETELKLGIEPIGDRWIQKARVFYVEFLEAWLQPKMTHNEIEQFFTRTII
jgi:hypothetical protein